MKFQMEVLMVGALLLAGCGGGGGGGSDTKRSIDEPSAPLVSAIDLTGTWIQTNVNYADPEGARQWFKTRRQTIVVSKDGDSYLFTDCNTGGSLAANLSDSTVTFQVFPGVEFILSEDAKTIEGTIVALAGTETDVALRKVSSNTQADLSITVSLDTAPVTKSKWDQVCVSTVIEKAGADTVDVKAKGTYFSSPMQMTMHFVAGSEFAPDQYVYPNVSNNDISGTYSADLVGEGNLSDPVGLMTVSEMDKINFSFDVDMLDDQTDSTIGITGLLKIAPEWLTGE